MAAPEAGLRLLRERLRATRIPDAKQVARLIADLDSDDYDTRQLAMRALAEIGDLVAPALREALAAPRSLEAKRRIEMLIGNPQAPAPIAGEVRCIRAVQILENIATAEAVSLLQALAKGTDAARLTREAREALERCAGPACADGGRP